MSTPPLHSSDIVAEQKREAESDWRKKDKELLAQEVADLLAALLSEQQSFMQ